MPEMTLEEYKAYIKRQRKSFFDTPYELVYNVFISLGLDNKPVEYFKKNTSQIVEELRAGCWSAYTPVERRFSSEMLTALISAEQFEGMTPVESVISFAEKYPDHIYRLSLSNTQSRRSRAGNEFEAIIELIMMGAGLPLDSQGNIGKKQFIDKGLGKLVDVVSPGVAEYIIDKNDVVLISAKTTLRERWQEVPEEMGRTGAREMFLATLDDNISSEVLDTLYENNIRIVTTKSIKQSSYPGNRRVLDFERLVDICSINCDEWNDYQYSEDQTNQIKDAINIQIRKHRNHDYVLQYYHDRLRRLEAQNE